MTRLSFLDSIRTAYKSELLFYLQYHQNRVNWMIHAVSIPLEWTSWLLFLVMLKIHWYVALMTALYFVSIGSPMAIPAAFGQIGFCWVAEYIFLISGYYKSFAIFALVQLCSWCVQVYIGHKVYEKNLPAMTVKLTLNSIVLSPLLAWDYVIEK